MLFGQATRRSVGGPYTSWTQGNCWRALPLYGLALAFFGLDMQFLFFIFLHIGGNVTSLLLYKLMFYIQSTFMTVAKRNENFHEWSLMSNKLYSFISSSSLTKDNVIQLFQYVYYQDKNWNFNLESRGKALREAPGEVVLTKSLKTNKNNNLSDSPSSSSIIMVVSPLFCCILPPIGLLSCNTKISYPSGSSSDVIATSTGSSSTPIGNTIVCTTGVKSSLLALLGYDVISIRRCQNNVIIYHQMHARLILWMDAYY